LRVRGGAAVDLAWSAGQLKTATFRATHSGSFRVSLAGRRARGYNGDEAVLDLKRGQVKILRFE
jgi:hypothetical protein